MIPPALYMDSDGNPINPTAASGGSRFMTSPFNFGVKLDNNLWNPDTTIQPTVRPQRDAAAQSIAYPPNPTPQTAKNDIMGRTLPPGQFDQPNDQPLMPAQNATQRWQEGATKRFYQRKLAKSQGGLYGRLMTKIQPGDANVPGYGTPAAPPTGLVSGISSNGPMTSPSMGYSGRVTFNKGTPNAWKSGDTFTFNKGKTDSNGNSTEWSPF